VLVIATALVVLYAFVTPTVISRLCVVVIKAAQDGA
jgi:hypothetical protein